MDDSQEERRQQALLRRFGGMGLETAPLPGLRGIVATMALGPAAFETPSGSPQHFDAVTFATVGDDRIKCLRPLPLFHLPFIRVAECSSREQIEERLREAWRSRVLALRQARGWLEKLGVQSEASTDAPVLSFPLTPEQPQTQVRCFEAARLVLPGAGALRGVRLRRAEDRVFVPPAGAVSAMDLELVISTRMEELARLDERLAREEKLASMSAPVSRPAPSARRTCRMLVVGPRLFEDRMLLESLRLRSYRVLAVRSAAEALRCYDAQSPEIVLAEMNLGRFEGIELIPTLRSLPGVEEIPVVLIDDRLRPERRETSKRAGAAGYLVRPIEVAKIASGLADLVGKPKRRRFTRFPHRLAVRVRGATTADLSADIGRGGMFVWTERDPELRSIERYEIALPELGRSVEVDAEVAHRTSVPDSGRRGLGLRFHEFVDRGEETLIAFLRTLAEARPAEGADGK